MVKDLVKINDSKVKGCSSVGSAEVNCKTAKDVAAFRACVCAAIHRNAEVA